MKRSSDGSPRARHDDAARHGARASVTHTSRRHLEHPEPEDSLDVGPLGHASGRVNRLDGPGLNLKWAGAADDGDAGESRLALARQRHARQRVRAVTLLFVLPTTVFSLMLMAMAHVVFRDWRSYESERRIAHAQLSALQEQLDVGQRRLGSLRSPKGREQILAEHGFIRPGDRLLLFPHQPGEGTPASNDIASSIAARRATIRDGASSSAWDRAARTMTGWLGNSTRAKPAPSTSNPSGASNAPSNALATPASTSGAQEDEEDEAGEAISPADRIVRPDADAGR